MIACSSESGSPLGPGLVEQFGEAVQGMGDGLGLGGIDQLGEGGEVDVLVAESDRIPSARRRGLLLPPVGAATPLTECGDEQQ